MKYGFGVLVISVLLCTGCGHRTGPNNLPLVVNTAELNALKKEIATYRSSPQTVTPDIRNNIVQELIGVSDDHYMRMRNRLLNSQNTIGFVGEVTSTTLSAVAALLGDADLKSILSTASTLTQSTKTNIDKSFFSNSSTGTIVAKMDALRAAKLKTIVDGTAPNVGLDHYGFEQALNDVRRYDDAGTVPAALIALAAQASTDKNTQEDDLAKAVKAASEVK
jgi:hypothetical protein